MDDLIRRLEEAKEGSRNLSYEVLFAVGFTVWDRSNDRAPPGLVTPDGKGLYARESAPDPSRSLDDALAHVVPEGMEFELTNLYGVARCAMGLNANYGGPWYSRRPDGNLALVLASAALKARQEGKGD